MPADDEDGVVDPPESARQHGQGWSARRQTEGEVGRRVDQQPRLVPKPSSAGSQRERGGQAPSRRRSDRGTRG